MDPFIFIEPKHDFILRVLPVLSEWWQFVLICCFLCWALYHPCRRRVMQKVKILNSHEINFFQNLLRKSQSDIYWPACTYVLRSFIAYHCNASLVKHLIAADSSFQFISQVCNFQDLREWFSLQLLSLKRRNTTKNFAQTSTMVGVGGDVLSSWRNAGSYFSVSVTVSVLQCQCYSITVLQCHSVSAHEGPITMSCSLLKGPFSTSSKREQAPLY